MCWLTNRELVPFYKSRLTSLTVIVPGLLFTVMLHTTLIPIIFYKSFNSRKTDFKKTHVSHIIQIISTILK